MTYMIQEEVCLDIIDEKESAATFQEDRRLTNDISQYGLELPLLVEGPVDGRYILVDGFKRIASLRYLEWDTVPCIVDSPTNEPTRISKKLRRDHHLKRMTVSQRIHHVHKLIGFGWDVNEIVRLTGISHQTILNYSRIKWVPLNIKEIARDLKLTENSELLLEQIAQRTSIDTLRFIGGTLSVEFNDVYKYYLEAIEQLTRFDIFNRLPRESIGRAVVSTARCSKFKGPNAQEILYKEAIISRTVKNREVFEVSVNYILKDITHLSKILTPYFISRIDKTEADQITGILEDTLRRIKKPAGFRL